MRSVFIVIVISVLLIFQPGCSKEKSCENCLRKEGTVTFYSLNGCINGRPIKLKINNQEYVIEQANFSVPECNGSGTVSLRLPAGDHPYQISCDFPSSSTNGTITVIENDCIKVAI